MQICTNCREAHNPDSAQFCLACGKGPLRRYRKRFSQLSLADLEVVANGPLKAERSSASLVILLLLVILCLLFMLNPALAASRSFTSAYANLPQAGKHIPKGGSGSKPNDVPRQLPPTRHLPTPTPTATPTPIPPAQGGSVQLYVSPAEIDITRDCQSQAAIRSCAVRLHNDGDTGTWSAQGNGGVQASPGKGTIATGQDQDITLTLPEAGCQDSSIDFVGGQSRASVDLHNCPAAQPPPLQSGEPHLTVTPSSIAVENGGVCHEAQGQSGAMWGCPVTLQNTGDGDEHWQTNADVSAQSGSIVPGGTQDLVIYLPMYCSNPTITFSGLNNSATVTISACPEPPKVPHLVAKPSIIDAQECDFDIPGQVWDCEVTLSNTGNGDDAWQTVSGQTDPPGNSLATGGNELIDVYVPGHYCNNPTITIQGRANRASIQITNCLQPSNLVVTPKLVDHLAQCSRAGNSMNCTVQLKNTGSGTANWNAQGDPEVRISSPSSFPPPAIPPGGSLTVVLNVPYACGSYQITFTAGSSQAVLNFDSPCPG